MNNGNKRECLPHVSLSNPKTNNLIFASKNGAYPTEATSTAPLWGRLLALPTNIRLGWKGLLGINTPSFFQHPKFRNACNKLVFVPGKPFQPSLMFLVRPEPTQMKQLQLLHSGVGSWPYPQRLL
jgi:hypothetical protein